MKKTITIPVVALVAALSAGCLLTGQITIYPTIEVTAATNLTITPIPVNLNDESDYTEHKDDIKSVDAISLVAVIKNNLSTDATATLYLSNDDALDTVEKIQDQATLVFKSPTVPGDDTLETHWADGFKYVENEEVIIGEVLGDGIFTIYVISDAPAFSLDVKAEFALTLTVGE